jgi:hypothetical protein
MIVKYMLLSSAIAEWVSASKIKTIVGSFLIASTNA